MFEQYKLYVEMTDRVSQRRMTANNFFTTINTGLAGLAAFINNGKIAEVIFVSLVGCVISITWILTLISYRQLNSGKFYVISKMEKCLPYAPYAEEWEKLGKGKDLFKYYSISWGEMVVPLIFVVVYLMIGVYSCI